MNEDFSEQAAHYFLDHHWFEKYNYDEALRHVKFLLHDCHAKEPEAITKMLTLVRGYLLEELRLKMPKGLP